jgi:uncharacterized membrane protein
MNGDSIKQSSILQRRVDHDFARFWSVIRANPERFVLGLGIFLRVFIYLRNRPFWMDESSLWGNLAGMPILDFSAGLTGDQLAPIGFLIAERALMALVGTSQYASRFLPLSCGLIALCLFSSLARRLLSRQAALVALVLFAFSDDLTHYSSELKPYSTDLAVGLFFTLMALDAIHKPITSRTTAVLAISVVAAPWLSFASAFVVAGCGMILIVSSLLARRLGDAAIFIAIGIGWLASFAVSCRASAALLSPYTTMYAFWYFAFLPLWPLPMDAARLASAAGILLEIFVNPLNLVAPLWPRLGVAIPIALLFLGGISLLRRSPFAWGILVLPIGLAMIASAMHRYPLHGRLILELVPAFYLLIAEGTEWWRGPENEGTRLRYVLVLILLFTYPCFTTFDFAAGKYFRDFNRHGDIHTNIFMS